MSFKEKAKAIHEAGVAERGNYSPAEGSVPLRMYNYWRNLDPERAPKNENFCHYWRVVLFWAPLWFCIEKVAAFFEHRVPQIIGLVALVASGIYLISLGGTVALQVIAMVLAVLFATGSLVLGGVALDDHKNEEPLEKVWMSVFFGSWLVYGIGRLGAKINSKVWSFLGKGVVGLMIGAALAFIVYTLFTNPLSVLIGVGLLVGLAALVLGLSFLSSYLKEKHKERLAARTTYETIEENFGGYTFPREVAVVEPTKIAKFFMAIGDFLNLAFQAVRVKKWKICPIVQIPTEK